MKAAATWEHVSTIRPDPDNPVIHTDEEVEELRALIADTVWTDPIVCRRADRQIIAGHRRLSAALLAVEGDPAWQLSDAPKPGTVPVRFVNVTPEQARRLLLADNAMTKQSAWDEEVLGRLLREMDAADVVGIGFDEEELRRLIDAGGAPPKPPASDDAPEVQQGPADSQPGQVYELGPHRLVCGDSTKAETWVALGVQSASCVVTDPPYGMSYKGTTFGRSGLANDGEDEFEQVMMDAMALARAEVPAALAAVFFGASRLDAYFRAMTGARFHRMLTVYKPNRVAKPWRGWIMTSEMCGLWQWGEPTWPDAGNYCHDVYTFDYSERPDRSIDHPTVKPLSIVSDIVGKLSSHGATLVDPFAGSGTTLIACAETGRVARCIELDPGYCDVIRRRWTRYARERNLDPGTGALDG